MSLFDNAGNSTLIRNEEALDFEYVPKVLPYREMQQKQIASSMKPLLQDRNGKNIIVHGAPGIGKTAATRWVIRDLEENTEDVRTFYINCWQKDTTYKIAVELCEQLDYRFVQNRNTEDLFKMVVTLVSKKPCVFVFDEIDKAEDFDFLYTILNEVYKKTIVLITNYPDWIVEVEDRIKSRLLPEMLEFKSYTAQETFEILKQRASYAFEDGVFDTKAMKLIADKSAEFKDLRVGIHMLREAAIIAEDADGKKVLEEHAISAIAKLPSFSMHRSEDLEEDTQIVVQVIKDNSGKKIGELFNIYKEKGGAGIYKSFQRKIAKLEKQRMITTQKQTTKEGNTTIVNYAKEKSLAEF